MPDISNPAPRNIVLIGMRASGKTECGRALAQRLGRPFLDLDDELERIAGRGVDEVLEQDGESAFRELEAQVLAEAAGRRGHVIATGGGAVLHGEAFEALARTGEVVYLQASVEELQRRAAIRPRPALKELDRDAEVGALLAERQALYEGFAQITIPVERGDPILAVYTALEAREGS
jgi:shikimate kinase